MPCARLRLRFVLSQHHHHHNHKHKHNNNNFSTTFILDPPLSRQNWIHTRGNPLDAFDISWPAHCEEKGHRLFAPGAFPPRVNLTAQSELSYPHTTTTTATPHRRLPSLATSPHSPPLRPAPAPAQRTGSTQSQQWLRHRRPPRSARKHPLRPCTVRCTTPTSHIPLAVQSEAPRKATLTPQLTPTARRRRISNVRPPRQPPARELALPTHISHLHLRHQPHHFDSPSCTRPLGRRLLAAHWPTCSVIPTTLHTANYQRHCLCYPHPARLRKSATLRP